MFQLQFCRCARTLAFALALTPITALAQVVVPIARSPDAGAARPWEAGLQVARHSSVNLYNGNMLTVIPIFRCDPVGPPLEFNLYHNSFTADATEECEAGWGFDLGGGWRVSYGSCIVTAPGKATLIEDDGNEWKYTLTGGVYVAPSGKFDLLKWDSGASEWTLTRVNQTRRIFNSTGFLIKQIDSAGNVLEIVHTAGRIDYIKTAADGLTDVNDHRLDFSYDGNGKLTKVTDVIGRDFDFEYEATGDKRLNKIIFPKDISPATTVEILVRYNSNSTIDEIDDKLGSTWAYTYSGAKLTGVTDPQVGLGSNTQSFSYPSAQINGLYQTLYTDRRAEDWDYRFADNGDFRERHDPLSKIRKYTYDSEHNRLTFENELQNTWTFVYGDWGILETLTSPLPGTPSQVWTYTWAEEVDGIDNFAQITQIDDPDDHWVKYEYTDATDATVVTKITEMDDGLGLIIEAETLLTYYDDSDPNNQGMLKLVTDHNGVKTAYEYDEWGYVNSIKEGVATGPDNRVNLGRTSDAAGRQTAGSDDAGSGTQTNDDADNATDNDCDADPVGLGETPRFGGDWAPGIAPMETCSSGNTFNGLGQPTGIFSDCMNTIFGANLRYHEAAYDALGRVTEYKITSDEHLTPGVSGKEFERIFDTYVYDGNANVTSVDGPDKSGKETITRTFDELGRLKTVVRDTMKTEYFYDAASRLIRIENRHDTVIKTKTFYTYDDANRVTEIRHENASATILSEIDYEWTIDNLVEERSEYDSTTGNTSVVSFGYDDRHRLTSESRTQDNPYSLSYTYDELGNRLSKVDDSDTQNVVTTEYIYDITDPDFEFPTTNNRLMQYGVDYDDDGTDDRSVFYTYYQTGHISNITIKDDADGIYRDLALYYARNGTLWLAVWGNFNLDEFDEPENYTVTAAREFRYDNPRQRYMTRDYDVSVGPDPDDWDPEDLASWTDYNGMMPYLDFDLDNDGSNNATFDEQTRYLAGRGIAARQDDATDADEFLHGDLIRSTVVTTDDTGAVNDTLSYTAFGQLVTSAGIGGELPAGFPRYAYAGGFGYESDLLVLDGASGTESIVLQHVGARWYQPDTGRFIMRDPIGLAGGINLYSYVDNNPLSRVDPRGTEWWTWIVEKVAEVARKIGQVLTGNSAPRAIPVCVPVALGLDALADGLGPVLRYRRAVKAEIESNPLTGN